ncbi:lipocalin family protein [Lutibacter sp. A64]|uniref:lipocalin family protein n=1 Tax=Lutibacter sp. A64 TaxID=2918526 RepID=UPI001F05893C|nr:lipocalin family protein [Lutibacter sp. A64]UMB54662.1 lipocalin family protein [Lutibacter sp. A64]
MKKLLMLTLFACTILSCGTSKTVIQSKKVIKGYWTLNDISYSESGTFNVTLLNDAPTECFEGSSWRFIPNNNTGIYTINNGDCVIGDRNFVFTIQEVDEETGLYNFLLKPTDAKNKSVDNKGFRLNLTQLSDTNMQWEQTVLLEGKPFNIYMNFIKNNE